MDICWFLFCICILPAGFIFFLLVYVRIFPCKSKKWRIQRGVALFAYGFCLLTIYLALHIPELGISDYPYALWYVIFRHWKWMFQITLF